MSEVMNVRGDECRGDECRTIDKFEVTISDCGKDNFDGGFKYL